MIGHAWLIGELDRVMLINICGLLRIVALPSMTVFAVIAAVEAVLVEPDHNPMKLDHGTPSVSGLELGLSLSLSLVWVWPCSAPS